MCEGSNNKPLLCPRHAQVPELSLPPGPTPRSRHRPARPSPRPSRGPTPPLGGAPKRNVGRGQRRGRPPGCELPLVRVSCQSNRPCNGAPPPPREAPRCVAIGGGGLSLTRSGSRPRPSSCGPTQPLGPGRAGSGVAERERSGFGSNRDGPGAAASETWRACGRAGGSPRAGRGPARGLGPGRFRRCSRRGCTVSTASAAASTLTSPTRCRSPPSSSTGEAAWMGPGSCVELGGAVGPAPYVGYEKICGVVVGEGEIWENY